MAYAMHCTASPTAVTDMRRHHGDGITLYCCAETRKHMRGFLPEVMHELQIEWYLMNDHQNDGHIPRSIVWYHPKHIACRAQGIAEKR